MEGRTDGWITFLQKFSKDSGFKSQFLPSLKSLGLPSFFSLTSSFQTSCSSSNWQICKMTPPDPKTSEPPGRSFNNWIIFVLASLQSHPRLPLLLLLLLPVNKLHWHETLTLPSPSFDANDYLSPPPPPITLYSSFSEKHDFPTVACRGRIDLRLWCERFSFKWSSEAANAGMPAIDSGRVSERRHIGPTVVYRETSPG